MEKTAVFSVIFPANLDYFNGFLESLAKQDDQHFDLLLVVDQVDIESYTAPFADKFAIKTYQATGSISAVRELGIAWLITLEYDYVIFADTDDLLSPDRVRLCRNALEGSSIVVNDLVPFTETPMNGTGYWRNRLPDRQKFTSHELQYYNFVGLGNSSVRREVLKSTKIPAHLQAVDWFLFFHWTQRHDGIFLHEGKVLYRQHPANLAGLFKVDAQRLLRTVNIKLQHYVALEDQFPGFRQEIERHESLNAKLKADPAYCMDALQQLNDKTINYFWWEETQYLK
jgi:glycosyltransferase involved in cell wall biosynthesis